MEHYFNNDKDIDKDSYDSSDDVPPHGWDHNGSFFLQQFQQFIERRNQTCQTTSNLLIDSRFRNVNDQIESNYLQTHNNYIACMDHCMYIKIPLSYQLRNHTEKELPESIQVILVNNELDREVDPIGGLSSSDLLYDSNNGGPIWEANLENYDKDTNTVKYKLLGIEPLESGYFGDDISQI